MVHFSVEICNIPHTGYPDQSVGVKLVKDTSPLRTYTMK